MERESESKSKMILIAILIAVFACVLRLLGLESSSLMLNEAENAVTALRLFESGSHGQLLYELPTAVIFKFFGSSEFSARVFPALSGVFLSVIPLCLYRKIGKEKALLLAFLMTVDPVLLYWSKRADAVIPSVMFSSASLAFLVCEHRAASLLCLLISLSGGERAWPAVFLAALCAGLWSLISKTKFDISALLRVRKLDLLKIGLVFVLYTAAFGLFPGGFGGLGSGFVSSFQREGSWAYPGLSAMLAAVLLYCFVPLLVCVFQSFREHRIPLLLIGLAAGAVLLLWKGIVMLPWISVLLWYAGSDWIVRFLKRICGPVDFPFFMSAFVVSGAYSFFYFRMVELFRLQNGYDPVQISWNGTVQTLPMTRFTGAVLLTIVSILILALVVKILMGFVELFSVRRGICCGLLIILGWSLVTGIWNAGGFDRIGDHPLDHHLQNTANVLNGAYTSYTETALFDLLSEAVLKHGDAKNTAFGLNFIIDDPMIEWSLRNHKGIASTVNVNTDLSGIDLILDNSGTSFESAGYVSTTQNWKSTMDWSRLSFRDWGNWLIFGDAQTISSVPAVLWVRADFIFTDKSE